ncbi:MAG: hypothetical protein L0Z62_12585 [Gemmataceae bacterium]|nr:hypothetical protein [Gemmataceae bacterium]
MIPALLPVSSEHGSAPGVYFGLTLKPGTVYYYPSDDLLGPARPHYHVVLSTRDRNRIVLVYASTKIERCRHLLARKHCPADTLVMASPATEPYLRYPSVFNCNRPVVESLGSLTRKYARRSIRVTGSASPRLLRQLIDGVRQSPLVAKQFQDLLRAGSGDPDTEG